MRLNVLTHQPVLLINHPGPSGNGKTELARWLTKLMNTPSEHDDGHFHKVDCGKLMDDAEIFGKSEYWQGAEQGSALNNFVLLMSQEPQSIGIVLLDEIEKASKYVITALYQVIDKGELTNKKLGNGNQTETIPCHNIIFIMTTNVCDKVITRYAKTSKDAYLASDDDFELTGEDLEDKLRVSLLYTHPFDSPLIGRVGHVIPFLPMLREDETGTHHSLLGEMMAVAKILIEREQEKFVSNTSAVGVKQEIDPDTKDKMAKIIVKSVIPEAGKCVFF